MRAKLADGDLSPIRRTFRILCGIISLILPCSYDQYLAAELPPRVEYVVDVRDPAAHLFGMSMTVQEVSSPYLDVALPAWLPGYNKIQEFARNLQEFAVRDGHGKALRFQKLDKQTWRIFREGDPQIHISYRIFANNPSNLNVCAHLDETHAFFNGAAIFLYPIGLTQVPVRVSVVKPIAWRIATALQADSVADRFLAPGYDDLIDRPMEIGAFSEGRFEVDGVPHHLAFFGLDREPERRLLDDVRKIVMTCRRLFGRLPYKRYVFIYHLTGRERRSGVEHADSTAIMLNRDNFLCGRGYDDFLMVTAHEYFHLWNIRRIRPNGWGPFDYSREAYTSSHWFTEGMTSYYTDLILVRAGLWSEERFFQDIASKWAAFFGSPGRELMSLAEASWDIWLKPDNAQDVSVSYYVKGAVVGLMLDLEIRRQTSSLKSLDDVFRYLDHTYGVSGRAYHESDLVDSVRNATGVDIQAKYESWVLGRGVPPIQESLKEAGLEVIPTDGPRDSPEKRYAIRISLPPSDTGRNIREALFWKRSFPGKGMEVN